MRTRGQLLLAFLGMGKGQQCLSSRNLKQSHIIYLIARSLDGKPVLGTDQYSEVN